MHKLLMIAMALLALPPSSRADAAPAGGRGSARSAPAAWETLPPTPRLPRPSREGRVAVEGGTVWYGEYGVGNRRVPVLLLHGGLASADYFGSLIPALTAAGYRVIAMDSRGHGRSSVSALPYSYALMARDVVALLDRLSVKRADIVGWSDGGIIGLQLGMTAPARVRRLFAFGTNASLDGLRPKYEEAPVFARYIARSAVESRAFGQSPTDHAAFLDQISKMWSTEPTFSPAQLARIAIPTTLAIGQYDEAISRAHVQRMDGEMPDSVVVTLPRVSHFAMIQEPAEFNEAVISFLEWR